MRVSLKSTNGYGWTSKSYLSALFVLTPPGGVYILLRMNKRPNTQSGTTPEQLRKRLHMVQGQIDGIIRMIDEGAACVDTLTQFKAAKAGLDKVFALYLEDNLRSCIALRDDKKRNEAETIIKNLIA